MCSWYKSNGPTPIYAIHIDSYIETQLHLTHSWLLLIDLNVFPLWAMPPECHKTGNSSIACSNKVISLLNLSKSPSSKPLCSMGAINARTWDVWEGVWPHRELKNNIQRVYSTIVCYLSNKLFEQVSSQFSSKQRSTDQALWDSFSDLAT